MNHETTPCESMAEAISLRAAGSLEAQAELALRQHLQQCEPCRQRFETLASVCANLKAATPRPAPPHIANIVSRVMAEVVAEPARLHLELPRTANDPLRRMTWWLVASLLVGLIAAGGIAWRSWQEHSLQRDNIAQDDLPENTPRLLVADSTNDSPPGATLFQLRQALEHSEDEMHVLMARHDQVLFAQPFPSRSLLLESN